MFHKGCARVEAAYRAPVMGDFPINNGPLRREVREGCVLAIYRAIITWLFLLAAFSAFPDQKTVIAFGVIFFSLGIGAVVTVITMTHQELLLRLDAADRKTRHAILAAHQWPPEREIWDDSVFWGEVDRKVMEEVGEPEPAPVWWKTGLRGALSLVWRALSDLIYVAVAWAMTAPY